MREREGGRAELQGTKFMVNCHNGNSQSMGSSANFVSLTYYQNFQQKSEIKRKLWESYLLSKYELSLKMSVNRIYQNLKNNTF